MKYCKLWITLTLRPLIVKSVHPQLPLLKSYSLYRNYISSWQLEEEKKSPWSYIEASESRQIFVTDRSKTLVLVCRHTEWTNPLESELVLKTQPITQDPLGAVASAMMTISPGEKFCLGRAHLCLSCIASKYSDIHHFQKSSAIYCTCLPLLLT